MGFVGHLVENEVEGAVQKVDTLLEEFDEKTKGLQECAQTISEEVRKNVKDFTNALDKCRNQATKAIHDEFTIVVGALGNASSVFGSYRKRFEACERKHSSVARVTCKVRIAEDIGSSFRKYSAGVRHAVLDNLLQAPKVLKNTAQCVSTAASQAIINIKNNIQTVINNCSLSKLTSEKFIDV